MTFHHRSFRTVMRDVGWGLSNALGVVGLFGAIATVLRLVVGSSYIPGVSLARLILSYVIIGVVAGLLIGVFRQLARHALGAAILGAVWGIALALVILFPVVTWAPFHAVFILIFCVGGAFLGMQIRRAALQIEAKRRAGLL